MINTHAPAVSIVTATYNRRHLLPRLSDSVLSQSLTDFEWIIVDDGSTDGTSEFVRSLADPRITLIEQDNRGCNAARNQGEAHARAEFILFIDSDDELVGIETLQRMVERIAATPDSIGVVAFTVETPEGGGGASILEHDEITLGYDELLCGRQAAGEFLRIFKRSALAIAPWATEFAGMEILKYLAIARKYRTLYVREPALIYHMNHGGNLTSAEQTILRASSMIKGHETLYAEHGEGFRHACPEAIGIHFFHTAMYCAIDGQSRRAWMHCTNSLREKGPIPNNLLLMASLLLPLSIRRRLFVWRSRLKGRI